MPEKTAMERWKEQQSLPAEVLASGKTALATRTEHAQTLSILKPRDLDTVASRVVAEAGAFPEGLTYSWKAGQGTVEGCGIKAAMLIARVWGNCDVSSRMLAETPESWLFEGEFYDQETNFRVLRTYRQRRNTGRKAGKMDSGRVEDADYQIGQSKAIRSAVLAGTPEGLQDAVFQAARKGSVRKLNAEAQGGAGLVKQAEKARAVFGKYKATREMLETRVGRPMGDWTAEDIQGLRELYQSLEEGHTSREKAFPDAFEGLAPETKPGEAPPADETQGPDGPTGE